MNIKNYTSTVAIGNSMGKIEKCLVEMGATDISKKYKDGICCSVSFRLMINAKGQMIPFFFQLPANVDAVFNVLWKEVKRPKPETRQNTRLQAERTAWKILSDWVEIQLSLIILEQAEPLQVLLPFVYNPQTEQTFYQKIKADNLKQLGT